MHREVPNKLKESEFVSEVTTPLHDAISMIYEMPQDD